MNIRHPYNFVPLEGRNIDKREWQGAPSGHERWQESRHSGTFVCKLKTKTLLSIKNVFEDCKTRNVKPVIPGSSLKGMVRSVAQALGAGCGYKYLSKDNEGMKLGNLAACDSKQACLVCRIFGYSPEREEFGWAGKVRFSDAAVQGTWSLYLWKAMPKGGGRWPSFEHRTRHKSFYFSGRQPLGWKIYRHAKNPRAALESEKATFWTDACVAAGTEFQFEVTYENLSDEEFALLRFALTLEHECPEHNPATTFAGHTLAHKLGYGKPAGLGSCTIAITDDRRENPKRYFRNETFGSTAAATTCPLLGLLAAPAFAKFLEYAAWDTAADHLLYPTKDFDATRKAGWFDRNPSDTIGEYESKGVPNWQLVKIKAIVGNQVESETERNGRTYKGTSSPKFKGLAAGGECFVWITKWNDADSTYEGITA